MRVAVVVEQLRREVPGGIGTYARGLLAGLAELRAEPQVDDEPLPDLVLHASRPRRRPDPLGTFGAPVVASQLPGPVLTRAWARGWLPAPQADVVHATSLAAPPTTSPLCVLVHDLAWRDLPDAYPARGRRWHEAALVRVVRAAAALVAPSAAVAEQLRAAAGEHCVVHVIEEGSDHLPPADLASADALLARLGVRDGFLLTVSTLEPRKNLRRLLDAYALARGELAEPWPLVVVGPTGWGDALVADDVPHGVLLAGHVGDATLAGLYRRARCLAYVPLTEGFGLPPVEAMRECTPVVASPVPSVAGAAVAVDPVDVTSIAAGLVKASSDERARSELVTAGLLRAHDLTWAETARRHVELWRALA